MTSKLTHDTNREYPTQTDSPRIFSGESQDQEMLREILSGAGVAEESKAGELISWAGDVVDGNKVVVSRVWEVVKGGMMEVEVQQSVLCATFNTV